MPQKDGDLFTKTKSMEGSFRGRGAPAKRQALVSRVADLRNEANGARAPFEAYWKRDEADIAGYVDKKAASKTDSRLRPGFADYFNEQWELNVNGILFADDFPIELTAASQYSEDQVDTNQAMLDHFLRLTHFQSKAGRFVAQVVGYGTGYMKIVRHTGKRMKVVREPVVDKADPSNVMNSVLVNREQAWPYHGPGIEVPDLWDIWQPDTYDLEDAAWIVERKRLTKRGIIEHWPHTAKIPDKHTGNGPSWEKMPTTNIESGWYGDVSKYWKLGSPQSGAQTSDHSKRLYDVYVMYDVEQDEIIVQLADTVLLDYTNMFPSDHRVPFVKGIFREWHGFPYGKSLPSRVHQLASAAEFVFNSKIDATQQALNPRMVVSSRSGVDMDELKRNHAGSVLQTRFQDARMAVAPVSMPLPADAAAMGEVQTMSQWLQTHSGVSNFTAGSAAGSGFNRTATGIVTLTQRQQNGFTQFADRLMSDAINPLGNMMIDSVHVMIDDPTKLQIVGKKGGNWDRAITFDDLNADVKAYPVRMRDHSERAQEAQLWLQLLQSGLGQDPKLDVVELYRRAFKALGVREVEKLVPDLMLQLTALRAAVPFAISMEQVVQEHNQLEVSDRDGSPFIKPPQPDEDDLAHLSLHEAFAIGAAYQALSNEAMTQLEMHKQTHLGFIAQGQQDQQAFEGTQAGPPAAGVQPPAVGPQVQEMAQQSAEQAPQPGVMPPGV